MLNDLDTKQYSEAMAYWHKVASEMYLRFKVKDMLLNRETFIPTTIACLALYEEIREDDKQNNILPDCISNR